MKEIDLCPACYHSIFFHVFNGEYGFECMDCDDIGCCQSWETLCSIWTGDENATTL